MKKIYKKNIGKEEVIGHFTTKVLNYTSNCQQMLGVSHIANGGKSPPIQDQHPWLGQKILETGIGIFIPKQILPVHGRQAELKT